MISFTAIFYSRDLITYPRMETVKYYYGYKGTISEEDNEDYLLSFM